MPDEISAAEKLPIEIWRIIFRIYLGPSLSKPEQDGLLAYRHFLGSSQSILNAYASTEMMRGHLSLVCRHWRDIVSDLDDSVLVSGPNDRVFPPGRSMSHAKRVIYVDQGGWELLMDPKTFTIYCAPRFLNPSQMTAKVMTITGPQIVPSDFSTPYSPLEATIKALEWGLASDPYPTLWHPMFQGLVALKISSFYPLKVPNTLLLPNLRCALLDLSVSPAQNEPQDLISKLSFPRMETLQLKFQGWNLGFTRDLANFICKHGSTIEELSLIDASLLDMDVLWPVLTRVRLFEIRDLESLAQALPALSKLWRADSDGNDRNRHLHVLIHDPYVYARTAESIQTAMLDHASTLARLELRLSVTWDHLRCPVTSALVVNMDHFLRILHAIGVVATDVEGRPYNFVTVNVCPK